MLTTKNSRKNSLIYLPGGEIFRRISTSSRGAGVTDAIAQATFNEKKWVWVEDKEAGYVAGYITKEMGEQVEIHFNDNSSRIVNVSETEKMNPPKFDKVEDMADLTHLNEASSVYFLLICASIVQQTYSGLFLVAVNPYHSLPIYTDEIIRSYKNKRRHEIPPHIYAISDSAYHDMLQERENQSILITGESGAGKTENTKKVIQYIATIASDNANTKTYGRLEQQILQANPILESFGNAQTIRNNNSSRFGKFIRIEFNSGGQISGANIERYLLEKSRVTYQTTEERNFHIFYQLLRGASSTIKNKFLLDGSLDDYKFIKHSAKDIDGVNDAAEFETLVGAMDVVGISQDEQVDLFRIIASILHLGNIEVTSGRDDQANILDISVAEKVCHVLGIPVDAFIKGLIKPQVKAGREWVAQARTKKQVLYSIEALAKALYERNFGALVERINKAIDTPLNKAYFIGVLDIAGFEIFQTNGFEQLCINYTNEKLQQFFNQHMFVLEQEQYKTEKIEWDFIDFGLDLQPTIDLIEKVKPVGILACLDEECVMPKATDKTFVEKLHMIWKDKSPNYNVPRFQQGFILNHYAAKVEYTTSGWLDKNKDPLNENVTKLLAHSSQPYIASLFSDFLGDTTDYGTKNRAKRGAFRTVGRRHKEQLHLLMQQLYSTHPHFVRCIVPNEEKMAGKIHVPLVLDQLRCNGVLEGIRICRVGFPNRLGFVEFRQRYEILAPGILPEGYLNGREAVQKLLEAFQLETDQYRLGLSKVFFRAGVLAELEEVRDAKLSLVFSGFQAHCRGKLSRKDYRKLSKETQAALVIQRNVRAINNLKQDHWVKLYYQIRPMLPSRKDEQIRLLKERIKELEEKLQYEIQERQRMESINMQLSAEMTTLEGLFHHERSLSLEKDELMRKLKFTEEPEDIDNEFNITKSNDQIFELEQTNQFLQEELEEMKNKYENEVQERKKDKIKLDNIASKLEAAELFRLKSETIEGSMKHQISKLEHSLKDITNELQISQEKVQSLKMHIKELEEKAESDAVEIADFGLFQQRIQENFQEEREKYRKEIEDVQYALEQLRKKYEVETDKLNEEIESDRINMLNLQEENKKLSSELRDLLTNNSKDYPILIGSERERFEAQISELSQLNNDLSASNDELQIQINNLLSEMSQLRTTLEETESHKILLEKLKKNLEDRLDEIHEQYHDASQIKRVAEKNLSALDKEVFDLKQLVEEHQDTANVLNEKLRKAEANLVDYQTELAKEKCENQDLTKSKIILEKQITELKVRITEFESKLLTSPKNLKRLETRLEELTLAFNNETNEKNEILSNLRKANRTIRELQYQLAEHDKSKLRFEQEICKYEQKVGKMREVIEEFQSSESSLQLGKRRAEREVQEARERILRLEKELEKSKSRLGRRNSITSLYSSASSN
ncbi:5958_t:CDS:10 [Funneliformis mosseae]|uniref:5958_t:CDS:1 n=1 Tax=Funneliformis mosseae TaxID=27381 RepID=A0A9N9GW97_FUNMO|nr:5958_t:CDS:10 [Funneliformis mosseae]